MLRKHCTLYAPAVAACTGSCEVEEAARHCTLVAPDNGTIRLIISEVRTGVWAGGTFLPLLVDRCSIDTERNIPSGTV
jgi:hypothetical protein